MRIANYSPDDINWRWVGKDGVIKSGEDVELGDNQAKHILTKVGAKGLVQLDFPDGDKDKYLEQKKADSMSRYYDFWELQITNQNQINEAQKEKGNRFARPTKELIKHAEALDLDLMRPWTAKDSKDRSAVKNLEDENKSLKDSLVALQGQMQAVMTMMAAKEAGGKPGIVQGSDDDIKANKRKYQSLQKETMPGWVKNNWELIKDMPEVNRIEIEEKYQKLCNAPYPTEKPE